MSAPRHTPGPWYPRDSRDASGDIAIVAPAGIVAECFMAIRSHNEVGSSEVHSNARLIAAAPALYEALEEISRGEGEFNRDPILHAENTIENMKALAAAALAKARGDQ